MSKEYASPLTLEFNQSKVIRFYLAAIHVLAATALVLSSVSMLLKLLVLALLLISFIFQSNRLYRYKKLIWLNENDWVLFDSLDNEVSVNLTPMSFSSSWLVILALRADNNKIIKLLVPFDALSKGSFRQLKVKLTILKPGALNPLADDD